MHHPLLLIHFLFVLCVYTCYVYGWVCMLQFRGQLSGVVLSYCGVQGANLGQQACLHSKHSYHWAFSTFKFMNLPIYLQNTNDLLCLIQKMLSFLLYLKRSLDYLFVWMNKPSLGLKEHVVFLRQSLTKVALFPKCWDYWCVSLCPIYDIKLKITVFLNVFHVAGWFRSILYWY